MLIFTRAFSHSEVLQSTLFSIPFVPAKPRPLIQFIYFPWSRWLILNSTGRIAISGGARQRTTSTLSGYYPMRGFRCSHYAYPQPVMDRTGGTYNGCIRLFDASHANRVHIFNLSQIPEFIRLFPTGWYTLISRASAAPPR